jgi:hypothetical protein
MLIVLMILCAAGAVVLIGLGAYGEFRELWVHPMKHGGDGHPEIRPHHPIVDRR